MHPAVEFLNSHYAPVGTRMQLMLGWPVDADVDAAARALVETRGQDALRRVCTLRPRPGEDALRTPDVVEFFTKYGHEYSAAWFGSADGLDRAAVSAAAAAVGSAVGWHVTTL